MDKARGRTILLIEDNPDDELLTLRALEKNRIVNRIDVVRDGAEALDYLLGEGHPVPELILLDLKLPKIDGLEVLKRLRASERGALVPVVILTSSSRDEDKEAGYRFGANSYVLKPIDFDEFNAAVRQLGMYWLLLNEPPHGPIGG